MTLTIDKRMAKYGRVNPTLPVLRVMLREFAPGYRLRVKPVCGAFSPWEGQCDYRRRIITIQRGGRQLQVFLHELAHELDVVFDPRRRLCIPTWKIEMAVEVQAWTWLQRHWPHLAASARRKGPVRDYLRGYVLKAVNRSQWPHRLIDPAALRLAGFHDDPRGKEFNCPKPVKRSRSQDIEELKSIAACGGPTGRVAMVIIDELHEGPF